MGTYLQAEKTIRQAKIKRVLQAIGEEMEEVIRKYQPAPAPTPQPVLQAPAIIQGVKYSAPELTASVLKFPCSPFDFIEWEDKMSRWLTNATGHYNFSDWTSNGICT